MAFMQYLNFNGTDLPLPDSYDIDLSDVEADSSGETEAGTTQRDVVRSGVVKIAVSFKELVSDKYFAKEIEKRIGVQTDTTAIDKELANYESKLKEVDLNKARLEREIDNLPIDARFRERKIHDMTLRLDGLYDTIVELEERIEEAKLRKSSIEMEAITLDNIYKLMLNFGKLYDIISDEEKKRHIRNLRIPISFERTGTYA